MIVVDIAYGTEYLLPGSNGVLRYERIDVLEVRDLRLVDGLQAPALDQRLHRVRRRHVHVVALGAGGELGEQLLVVRIVGLHDGALAELLEALDRLRREVVVPVVEVELVLRGGGRQGEDERGEQKNEAFHGHSWSAVSRLGERREAMMISASVSSINSVDTALTSGVTAILIIE